MSGPSLLAPSQNLPYSSTSVPTTPQQKVVYVLVNRLKNKLPYNSGITLTEIEADDAVLQVVETLVEMSRESLDIIGWALTELLEKLAKQTDSNGFKTVDVLQSQLFILKVLSICMASRWGRRQDATRPDSRNSKQPTVQPMTPSSKPTTPDSPAPTPYAQSVSSSRRRQQGSTDHLSVLVEPPPLDENCARYILSVMVMLLRQTAPLKPRLMTAASMDFAASHHDFESVDAPDMLSELDYLSGTTSGPDPILPPTISPFPQTYKQPLSRVKYASSTSLKSATPSTVSTAHTSKHSIVYEKTSIVTSRSASSLNTIIAKFAGRIVYHLSASNWSIVLHRIRNKIHTLANSIDSETDAVDLQLMMHSALDKTRLTQSLQELSSLLLNMKPEAQLAVAIPLRAAIWNWIDLYPEEFNETLRYHRRMDGAPERVFDILWDSYEMNHKPGIWPTLSALSCISTDRLKTDYQANSLGLPRGHYGRRDRSFAELMMRSLMVADKLSEEALICALDMARAFFRLHPADEGAEHPLQMVAHDVAHEVKRLLLNWDGPKAFWECPDEIDVALVADAMVTAFRFLPQDEMIPIFKSALEPERSHAVKISAIKACITMIREAPRCPWQVSLTGLRDATASCLLRIYHTCTTRRSEVDSTGTIKKAALRPRAKRYSSETLPDPELLSFSVLALFRADPMWHLASMDDSQIPGYIPTIIRCWGSPGDQAVKMAMSRTFRTTVDRIARMVPEHPFFQRSCTWLANAGPAILATACTNLLNARTDFQAQRLWVNMAYEIIYRFTRDSVAPHMKQIQLTTGRLPSFAIAEIAFLVSLTSADANVTLTAAHCLRLLAQAETSPDVPVTKSMSEEERVKRYPIYEQLGDPRIMVIGRIGHQKRVRKLMRLMPSSSAVHIAVWEECFFRWVLLNEMVIRDTIDSTVDGFDSGRAPIGDRAMSTEERLAQWQNLALFLASFGSACARNPDAPFNLTLNVAPYFLPDQLQNLRDPEDLFGQLLRQLIDLLIHETIIVRDTARDALGSEASPRLYTRIFKELDNVVKQLSLGDSIDWDNLAIFVEQFLGILKVLVENVQYLEEIRGMELPITLSVIAGFIGRFHDIVSYRLRLKFCNMCESVFNQGETMAMRKDGNNRQKIVDIIVEWIQDTSSCDRDLLPIQRDINVAAFRAAVKLFDRLKLEPPDGTSSEETAHVVSRLFARYSAVLFRVWDTTRSDAATADDGTDKSSLTGVRSIQRDGELRELVITGLASLVSANPEVGVKHCLPLAYDEDPTRRIIFCYVFCRVLPEGISLASPDHQPMVHRQSRLCELVKGPDMSLALAICEVCPAGQVDNLISVMLNLFDTRSSLMTLLKNMIDVEVARTESDTSLFRGNSTCTRFLSAFANVYGYNYLRSLIIPLIKTMTSMPAGHGYDLNPAKVGEQVAEQNRENIKLVTSSFLQIILSSIPAVPPMLREICAHIAKVVNDVWPEAKFAAVGAFMFLRFISPAIVAPETIDIQIPQDDLVIRRGLMLVAKIIQNLANNIFFGKEAHMVVLNEFLSENIFNVTKFLSELNKFSPSGVEEEPEEWLETTYDDTDTIVLHRFLEKHADKVGKELLSTAKPSEKTTPQTEASAANGKRIWDALCAALVELGSPLETPRLSNATTRDHHEYLDLMARYEHRDMGSMQDILVEASTPSLQDKAIFILSISKIDVEVLDVELLVYYIFKVLGSPAYVNREFEMILDYTSFSFASQLPVQWIKFAYEVTPADIRKRFRTTYVLTPNTLAVKSLRRTYNLTSGMGISSNMVVCSTLEELLQHMPEGVSLPSLHYAMSLEGEPCDIFDDVTVRQAHPMRVPVQLQVAQSHLRITTMKAQSIGGSLSCKATDIIPLADINDVYNVSTGHDPNEFIIRKTRHGITLYFSSPVRDVIVKSIRNAKSNMRPIQLPGTERLSRFSNVVATLLHVGMIGVCSIDEDVKIAANVLLQAICVYLDFEGRPLLTSKISMINGLPGPMLVQLSDALAEFAPHLTLDFITEVSTAMGRAVVPDRIVSMQYMAPWTKNLAFFTDPTSQYYEHSATKFRDCIRVLVDLTMVDHELDALIQRYIWTEIGKLDSSVVNAVLDELMRAAVDGGIGSVRCARVADSMGAMSSINIRGRLLSRLRKVIGKTSTKPTKNLGDNVHWNEIACLVKLVLVACHHGQSLVQSLMFLPEAAHLVTLTAGIGQTLVRTSVYGVIVGLTNGLYTTNLMGNVTSPELQQIIGELEQPETLRLFGLLRPTPTSDYVNFDPPNDKLYIDTMEGLVRFLVRVLEVMSGTKGLLNVWRARWMSLVTSSAFQLSPAVQTRAFVALGVLATSDVDDDLLYQMLVAFKTALTQSSESDTMSVIAMLRCIRYVAPHLPRNSRYLCQLFWLAVALLQSSHRGSYVEAIQLLRVTLETMDKQGAFKEHGVAATLLEGRAPLEEVACQLDQLLGLSFESNFSFSLAAIIFKGMRHPGLRDPTEAALRSLMKITVRSCGETEHADDGPESPICQDILGYFLALLPASTTVRDFRRLLEESAADKSWMAQDFIALFGEDDPVTKAPFALLGLADGNMALFVTSFIGAMLTTAQSDDTESKILYNLLSDTADAFPDVVTMTYESLLDKIREAFANSSSPEILSAVSNLFRVAVHDSDGRGSTRGSVSTLSVDDGATHGPGKNHLDALGEQGMQGLTNSFQFLPANQGQAATKVIHWISELVTKIIE